MRRVLVVTWALGTASGVLLGLFGVQLVSSRFSTSRVSPLSHPEVLRALQAARSVPVSPEEIALPAASTPDAVPPSPPVDVAPARPSDGATSTAAPASSLPRPGVTAGTLADPAAVPPTTVTAPAPPESSSTSTTAATVKPTTSTAEPKSDGKGSGRTTASTAKKTTTTTAPPQSSKPASSDQPSDGTRTITSDGGIVVVKFSDGKVRYQMARPNAGYEVHVVSYGPDYVLVYFDKGNRGYRVWASYYRDKPFTDVTRCSGAWPRPDCRG